MNNILIKASKRTLMQPLNLQSKKQNTVNNTEILKAYRRNYKNGKRAKGDKDYTNAYSFFKESLYYAKMLNWIEAVIYSTIEIADIDSTTKNYKRAYKYYMSCLNIALMNDLDSMINVLYFKLSRYYAAKGNLSLSQEYNSKAIKSICL